MKAGDIAIPLSRMEQVDEELEENLVGFMEKTTMGKNLGRFSFLKIHFGVGFQSFLS